MLVARDAPLRKMDRGAGAKLVLVSAPLGWGKTTLLAQWYREACARRLFAWLSLDELDNAPERFFSYLVGAIRRAAPDFDAYIASPLDAQVELPLDHAISVVLRSLWNLGRELVVVLDDFHVLREPALVRAFSYLLEHSPPHVHWVVSSRSLPELGLAKLKLTEQLVMLDSRDLRLDGEAIRELGQRLCDTELAPDDVEYLRSRTEGWVAGVKLALLSVGEHANVGDALRKAIGSNRDVARYLADAVLREQSEEVHEFLVLSSVVDQLNGELCNALLGITHGPALLANLERAQLFIQPLDAQRQWYRYHALFLDFLRTQLACDFGDRIPWLHRAASAWFAEHQRPDEALKHAFASGDRGWCLEITARCAEAWMREGEIASVLHWTEKLTTEEVIRSPALCVAHIACLILSRRYAQALARCGTPGTTSRPRTARPNRGASGCRGSSSASRCCTPSCPARPRAPARSWTRGRAMRTRTSSSRACCWRRRPTGAPDEQVRCDAPARAERARDTAGTQQPLHQRLHGRPHRAGGPGAGEHEGRGGAVRSGLRAGEPWPAQPGVGERGDGTGQRPLRAEPARRGRGALHRGSTCCRRRPRSRPARWPTSCWSESSPSAASTRRPGSSWTTSTASSSAATRRASSPMSVARRSGSA
ncbi:AAA family ATPase [Cystobacter fuscus]